MTKAVSKQNTGGRPTKYNRTILKKTKAYFKEYLADAERTPMLGELALILGIHRDTLHDWYTKKKPDGTLQRPEFSDLIKMIQTLQEVRMYQNGFVKDKPLFEMFVLRTQHGHVETTRSEHAAQQGGRMRLMIEVDDQTDA